MLLGSIVFPLAGLLVGVVGGGLVGKVRHTSFAMETEAELRRILSKRIWTTDESRRTNGCIGG